MKQVRPADQLSLTINGASIVPELARTLTKKQGGHHVALRITYNRVILAYLATDIYVVPTLFNPKTKQLVDPNENNLLMGLLSRASKLVAKTLNPQQLKKDWKKERLEIAKDSTVEIMDSMADWQNLTRLYSKRDALSAQLQSVLDAISGIEKAEGLTPVTKAASALDVEKYVQAREEFMLTLKGRSQRDQDAFTWVWENLAKYAAHANTALTLQSFDYQFYLSYGKFCMYVTDNYDNFFGAKVKKLKQFLKYAEERGYKVNIGYKDRRFKILDEKKEVVYLDDSELEMIWQYKNVNPKRSKVVDCILFQSLTGLRVSDALKQHRIITKNGEKFLTGICKKNKGTFLVPMSLDPRISEILISRDYDMGILSDAVYNRQIKLVMAEAYAENGLSMPEITYHRFKMGKPFQFTEPKCQLISSHSMRRGFCTRHLNSGYFNETDVLQMLG